MRDVGKEMKTFWSKLTPAERSAEMIRRRQVAEEKKKLGMTGKRIMSQAGRDAIRKAQQRRWKKWKKLGQRSPFGVVADNPGSIRARLEAIEAAVAQLKADIGLE